MDADIRGILRSMAEFAGVDIVADEEKIKGKVTVILNDVPWRDALDIIVKTKEEYAPSILAKYLLNLASLFNSFYAKEKVIVEDPIERYTKLHLLKMTKDVLNDGMKLLGMQVISKM